MRKNFPEIESIEHNDLTSRKRIAIVMLAKENVLLHYNILSCGTECYLHI